MSGEKKLDASSEHFNMVAAQRDQEPSTISCTNTISESIKKMDWYVSMKNNEKSEKKLLRAMDFGCGTGLLSTKILDPAVFEEIIGIDVAEGMINAFHEKIKIMESGVKMTAICSDLGQISLESLNSTISNIYNENVEPKKGFDIIFTLLAFHHLKDPEKMLNQVLKEYLNPGGRILIMDYEQEPMKQKFHPVHLVQGKHYEHDGFVEKTVQDWFKKGNSLMESRKKWDLESLEITKVPFLKPVNPKWKDLIPKRKQENHTMLMITCCTNSRLNSNSN